MTSNEFTMLKGMQNGRTFCSARKRFNQEILRTRTIYKQDILSTIQKVKTHENRRPINYKVQNQKNYLPKIDLTKLSQTTYSNR